MTEEVVNKLNSYKKFMETLCVELDIPLENYLKSYLIIDKIRTLKGRAQR